MSGICQLRECDSAMLSDKAGGHGGNCIIPGSAHSVREENRGRLRMQKGKSVVYLIEKAVNTISYMSGLISGYFALGLGVIITYDVSLRYLFNEPTLWVFETSEYLVGAIVFMGASYCLLKEGHVRVDIITNLYSPQWRAISNCVTDMLSLFFCAVFTWQAWLYWWPAYRNNWKSDTLLELPLGYPYFFMALGMTLLTIQYIFKVRSSFIKALITDSDSNKEAK
jgi:TRAP-type C4-dicarboxylate transport system permease small subunit